MDLKSNNVHAIKVKEMNCYFSQICEVTTSSPLNKSTLFTSQELNAFVTFKNQQLFIITKGGNKFYLPLDQQISKIFPLVEGIMIQFFIKTQSKLQQILFYQRNKDMMDIEEPQTTGKYCYATLTRHPLNPLKILGGLMKNELIGWHKVKEKVTCVCQKLPIMLTYNEELKRNAIHVLRANNQQIEQQNKFAYIPTQTYSLKNVGESCHYEVIVETIYESTDSGEEQINDIRLTKGLNKGELFIYGNTVYNKIRIYSVDLYAKIPVHLLKVIQDCKGFGTTQLYSLGMVRLKQFEKYHQPLQIKIVSKMLQGIEDCLYVIDNSNIRYFYKGKEVFVQEFKGHENIKCINNEIHSGNRRVKVITPFIDDCFVGLIAHTFELTLSGQSNYIIFLNQYKNGQPLSSILLEMQNANINVLLTLHLLAEELKLYELMKPQRQKLCETIMDLAVQTKKYEYMDYYLRQGFHLLKQIEKVETYLAKQQVLDLFSLINKLLLGLEMPKTPINCIFNRSNFILNFIQILVKGEVFLMIEPLNYDGSGQTKFGKEHFFQIRYPLLSQKVYHMTYFNSIYENQLLKNSKPENKEQRAFIYLIQNNQDHSDILSYAQSIRAIFYWLLREMRRNLPFSLYEVIPELGFNLIHREDLYKNIKLYNKKQSIVPYHLQKPSFDEHIKTLVHTSTSQEYFLTSNASEMNKINNDLIFEEVDRLLSSVSQIKVKNKDISHIPNHKREEESQNILIKFANRKLSVLTGEGAFNFGTSRSFITDIIKIPKININGVMPDDIRISLDLKEDKESMVYWPQFHSGLAAGLKLSRHVIPLSQDHLKTWIFYQKPDTPKRDHSGFLLSLGLLGYLKCFSPTDIYQYLKPNNEFTSIAILLGVSASNISRSDESLSKTLILHIPVLLPPSVDLQIPINVQTSALIGIGLLHKGTCNRTMTEMTLSQIGKKPSSDKCLDREGYSLAAGWALGMICLGMNDTKQSFRDLQLQQRLIRFIQGGKVMQPPQSMISTNFVNENRCSSIKEGQNVNLHITAPAALLSISFMYLKSNYRELADKISIPNSFNTIEECNPNHVLLKTVAKNLIMWDNIKNTKEYVLDQIPELIRFIVQNSLRQVHEQYYLIYNVSQIDYQTITTIYASVMTGSIISMALKFAGTGDIKAVQTIKWHIQQLKQIKIIKCQFANDPLNKNCIDQYELFSLLSVSVLALSIVMAGTCDIECLKIIKVLRKKFQDSKVFHYGFSMALNMAFGFIFLGYGNYTFNRENMSIAALLISIFPQFPNSPTDNKWHLQALRHFYVLAMEQKIFHAVDVDTNKVVSVNTEMEFIVNDRNVKQNLHTPILLQQSKKLVKVKIRDEDYFDIDFSFCKTKIDPKAIYIKKKYFKNINPNMLDKNNVLSTSNIKDNVKESLQKQIRYKALFREKEEKVDLSYILGKKYSQKLKLQCETRENERDLYFSLLKDDNLELMEIYLNLRRELKDFHQRQSRDNYNVIKNYQLMKSFQKWCGSLQFEKVTGDIVEEIEKKFISNPLSVKYLQNPYNMEINGKYRYDELGLLSLPSSRNLGFIKKALSKLKGKKEKVENIEFLVFSSFPECSFTVLNYLISVY